MSFLRLVLASLLHHWRMNLAVALGVAAGTAVLTGALLVGESMRGSLRDLTLERLGPVDEVLVTGRFFREALAEELAEDPRFQEHFDAAVPAILLRTSISFTPDVDPTEIAPPVATANRVNLIGCDERFWQLGATRPETLPEKRQIVLNRPLADRLKVKVGQQLVGVVEGEKVKLRLPAISAVPGESLLGEKTDTVDNSTLTVAAIIPRTDLGRFNLRPNQQLPLNAYVSLDWLQGQLQAPAGRRPRRDRPVAKVNAVLVTGRTPQDGPSQKGHDALAEIFQPKPADYGITVRRTERGYFNITSDRMLIEPAAEEVIDRSIQGLHVQRALIYLANQIDDEPFTLENDFPDEEPPEDRKGIPYSTIAAVDFGDVPLLDPMDRELFEQLADTEHGEYPGLPKIVLNSWAADDRELSTDDTDDADDTVDTGKTVYVTFFDPESTHGRSVQQTVEFELVGIVELDGPADDPDFTPTVTGVTDRASISTWDPPFAPFHRNWLRKDSRDDTYWKEHRTTPKAFVSLETGRRLWGSRFGQTTSFRVAPADGMTEASLAERLKLPPAPLGFAFQPVKQQGLDASVGATPFDVLFLMFSFFVIAAAVMLVALLFQLAIGQRAGELGTLLAVGFTRRRIARLLAAEGLVIATAGSLAGLPLGVGYAALMLWALQTMWIDAIVTPFLQLHVGWLSLAIGLTAGTLVAQATILWTLRSMRRLQVRQLLAGQTGEVDSPCRRTSGKLRLVAGLLLLAALGLGLGVTQLGEDARAAAFFGVGALVLVALLLWFWNQLRGGDTGPAITAGRGNLFRMAARNAARNPLRSTLTVGLVAATSFLIIAVSAFHIDPTGRLPSRSSGDGGFALAGQSDQPIYHDLNTADGQEALGILPIERDVLAGSTTFPLRASSGDDASCLNLYQARQPRVLGVPPALIDRGGFDWAATADGTDEENENPWRLLDRKLGTDDDPIIPVVIEKNTAMYALHKWRGVGEEPFELPTATGKPVRLQIVGLLNNGIFQGDLLIRESAFLEHFPEAGGYRFFLTELPAEGAAHERIEEVGRAMQTGLADQGMFVETTGDRLAGFLAVQNTYLSTFQSLGGLGLLLGVLGLAAVGWRNVIERRRELALMRAAGWRRRRLGRLVMIENGLLLTAGLAVGTSAAVVAVLPHLLAGAAVIPWLPLTVTIGGILAIGAMTGLAGVVAMTRAPLVAALRGD